METQVNVAPDGGERIQKEFKGKKYHSYTDHVEEWKSFRIPWNADSDPKFEDRPITWNFEKHVEAIGLTGWDWKERVSRWVGFDFDSLIGHQKGLTTSQLDAITSNLRSIPWVTLYRSKSGHGIHVYVFLDPVIPTANHREHAGIARAILSILSATSGQDLQSQVDKLGEVLWIWHRDTSPGGFKLIKAGQPLKKLPPNWRDHIAVVSGKSKRIKSSIPEGSTDEFDDLISKYRQISLDRDHRRLLEWLDASDYAWWWDMDHHMLVTHTAYLKQAHKELKFKGLFYTISSGKDAPNDVNCFAFPIRDGAWTIRRQGIGTTEHAAWDKDSSGWTKCLFNRPAKLSTAAIAHGGVESEKEEHIFSTALKALAALQELEVPMLELPNWIRHRPAMLIRHKKHADKVIFSVKREPADEPLEGWLTTPKGDWWKRVLTVEKNIREVEAPDELLRHVVTSNKDAGWFLLSRSMWIDEPKSNLYNVFAALGINRGLGDQMLGQAILNHWEFVSIPFEEEYPGNRRWNRNAAQLSVEPVSGPHPTWDNLLHHIGTGLDDAVKQDNWCKQNGLVKGADYLRCWVASVFQEPFQPLPYLFFYGPQNSGKSTFHEALGELFTIGHVLADTALTSQGRFNAELEGAVLCVVEETDLRQGKQAYERIKSWVTGRTIGIHQKGMTPRDQINTSHWVQCANDPDHCPILPGDTRIVVNYVDLPSNPIPKAQFMSKLRTEMAGFLYTILHVEIPPPADRLRIPVIMTLDKIEQESFNTPDLHVFLKEKANLVPGHAVKLEDLYRAFVDWIGPEQAVYWNKRRMSKSLPRELPKGRYTGEGYMHIGNISLDQNASPKPRLVKRGDRLSVDNGTDILSEETTARSSG